MIEYNNYRKTAITRARPYVEGEDMTGVSVSQVDKDNGSPKPGDMIAFNPAKPTDVWLIAEEVFKSTYELEEDR